MLYRLLAELILYVHCAFVAFVLFGALLTRRWPAIARLHVPALIWGVATEFLGLICPLTPLESLLLQRGGAPGYSGGCIGHYLVPLLYPVGLTRATQFWLGTFAICWNLVIYAALLWRRHRLRTVSSKASNFLS